VVAFIARARVTGTRELIALRTGGMLQVGMSHLELGWPGRKCERALEVQREWAETKHARRDLYRLCWLSFSLGMAMLGWWRNGTSAENTR
jgi:hypothetical protein